MVAVAAVWLVSAGRVEHRAPAELAAVLRLLTLIAVAVLPIALAVCAAVVLSAKAHGGCSLGYPASRWLAGGLYALALALVVRVLWVAARLLRVSRGAIVRGSAARLVGRIPLADGRVALVLPVEEPIAYSAGLGRPQVVVSSGLLDALEPRERGALLAHELAHARGGHPRMLFVGSVVAGALGFLPPVRRAFASLRRQLEAAADDGAVAAVGDPGVVARAIAKAALAGAPALAAPLTADCDLGERLDRLACARRPSPLATALAAGGGMLIASALIVSVCIAVHGGALAANFLLCLGALGALALPPLLRARETAAPSAASR